MPCMISRWSLDLVFIVFVIRESDPNNALSLWMMRSSLLPMGGRGSLIVCGWVCCPWGQKTTCKRDPIWHPFSTTYGGERKTLRVWVRLLSMGPRDCIPKRTISCQLWMGGSPDLSMWLCGIFVINYPYVIFYSFGNYIVSAHRS